MDIFNNREIALAFWLTVLGVFMTIKYDMKPAWDAIKIFLKVLFSGYIIIMISIVALYVAAAVYILDYINLWEWHQLKNTIVWFFAIALVLIFEVEKNKYDPKFFKKLLIANFKFLAIIEFIVGLYSFNIVVEFIIVPILLATSLLLAVTTTKESEDSTTLVKLLNGILIITGTSMIVYTIYMLYYNIGEVYKIETLYNFYIPPLLTLMYLPFIYLFMIYTEYENIYIRLRYFIKDKRLFLYTKLYTMLRFNFRYKKLNRWSKTIFAYDLETFSKIKSTIDKVFNQIKVEKKPPVVSTEDGWSPYLAEDFLLEHGLKTDYYHFMYDDIWSSSSNSIKLNKYIFENTITYILSGNEHAVKVLKLKLFIGNLNTAQAAKDTLLAYVEILTSKALDCEINNKVSKSILNAKPSKQKIRNHCIEIKKNDLHIEGFTLEVSIFLH